MAPNCFVRHPTLRVFVKLVFHNNSGATRFAQGDTAVVVNSYNEISGSYVARLAVCKALDGHRFPSHQQAAQ